jgi:DNA-directed RNA polymerase alpha subunit
MNKITKEYLTAKNVIKICESSNISLDSDFRDLNFIISVRLYTVLRVHDIRLIRDLLSVTLQDYEGFRNLGIKTLREIKEFYVALGIHLIDETLD